MQNTNEKDPKVPLDGMLEIRYEVKLYNVEVEGNSTDGYSIEVPLKTKVTTEGIRSVFTELSLGNIVVEEPDPDYDPDYPGENVFSVTAEGIDGGAPDTATFTVIVK